MLPQMQQDKCIGLCTQHPLMLCIGQACTYILFGRSHAHAPP